MVETFLIHRTVGDAETKCLLLQLESLVEQSGGEWTKRYRAFLLCLLQSRWNEALEHLHAIADEYPDHAVLQRNFGEVLQTKSPGRSRTKRRICCGRTSCATRSKNKTMRAARIIELQCDAAAVIALDRLGMPTAAFASALEKMIKVRRQEFDLDDNAATLHAPLAIRQELARRTIELINRTNKNKASVTESKE